MGFLDNVKAKLGGLTAQGENGEYDDYAYDQYDSYEDGYQDDARGSRYNGNGYSGNGYNGNGYNDRDDDAGEQSTGRSGFGTPRSRYKIDDHAPLVTHSDVRSQSGLDLQQSTRTSSRSSRSTEQASYSQPTTTATTRYSAENGGSSRVTRRTATAPYGTEATELRGDTPDFYASRSGQVRARGTTGNFPAQGFRQLVVVRPATYADAEKVADSLKQGNAVAIDLRNTRPELAKRILDFSFGAASVLGGQVETPANRVYVISVGIAMTADERELLVARGVLQ